MTNKGGHTLRRVLVAGRAGLGLGPTYLEDRRRTRGSVSLMFAMNYTGVQLRWGMGRFGFAAVAGLGMVLGSAGAAEVCTTQSKMQAAERDGLANAARGLAERIAANDQAGVKSETIREYQQDFGGMADAVAGTAPRLKGAAAEVEEVYLLDASSLVKTASGGNPDAQFFCTLNGSQNEAGFQIPQLPPGRYGFAMVAMNSAGQGQGPWRLSFLLRQEGGQWKLAGLYPKPLTAAGHDGLWYWKEARGLNTAKEPWAAWLYYLEAQALLQPAGFVSSTHLDKLGTELAGAAPPAVASGVSVEAPLVVKGADGVEYRFTSLGVDDSLSKEKVDVAAHLKVDALGDAAAARKRNVDAMAALVAAHPELRKAFHGVWVFAEAPGQSPYGTELAMGEIR